MTKDAQQILTAALALSEQERAELAEALLLSVPFDERIAEAQRQEGAARVKAFEAGELEDVSAEEARRIISG